MSLPPLEWVGDLDLDLIAPDLLDSIGPQEQIGAAGELVPNFLSDIVGAQSTFDLDHAALASTAFVGSTDTAADPESDHENDSSPSDTQRTLAPSGGSNEMNKEADESLEARRLQLRALEARLFRKRKKNEMEELRAEATVLADQLECLRSSLKKARGDKSVAEWEERAIVHRRRLAQSEAMNAKLKRALYEQRGLVRGLLGCLSSSPVVGSELNLQRILHSYIRLGLSPRARLRALQSVGTDSRLDLAHQVVDRETTGVPFDSPNISTKRLQTLPTEFGANSVAVYAFQTTDVRTVFQSACIAITGSSFDTTEDTADNKPAAQVRYSISNGMYTSDATGEEFRVAVRIVSFARVTDAHALLLWDYVDADDLNPVQHGAHVKMDFIGVMMVRREVCADGVERVVCRHLSTKMHRLNSVTVTSSLEHLLVSGAQLCTQRVYRLIKEMLLAQQVRPQRVVSRRRSPCPVWTE